MAELLRKFDLLQNKVQQLESDRKSSKMNSGLFKNMNLTKKMWFNICFLFRS